MRSRYHGEKKGLDRLTQEDVLAAGRLLVLSKKIEGSSPSVEKFIIKRNGVLQSVLSNDNQENSENVDPSGIQESKQLKLTRAEWPLMFDVASLTRNLGEQDMTLPELQFGEVSNVQDDEENDYDGEDYDGIDEE